jgi:predicted nucleic-acid-binding Zn-ribbon protein
MESRTCPKCGSNMQGDKQVKIFGSELELVSENGFLGDKIRTFYCESCGFLELYREKRK